jgi:hypothetical protein
VRLFSASIVVGSLMLIGALPAGADQQGSSNAHTQWTAVGGSSADHDTYAQKVRGDMQDWQQRLQAFGEKAKSQGRQADNATANALNAAWSRTQEGAHKLQTATAEGWESAKASYEKASNDLAGAWARIRPEDK